MEQVLQGRGFPEVVDLAIAALSIISLCGSGQNVLKRCERQ